MRMEKGKTHGGKLGTGSAFIVQHTGPGDGFPLHILAMKALFFALLLMMQVAPVRAQEVEMENKRTSPRKAAVLSLLLPGLGHRYVNNGSWRGAASFFALAEAGFWLGMIGADWQQGQTIESYRTLAASRAGADLAGKDRRFLVNLGLYQSSDAFREDHLRRRLWDQVNYVSAPAFQWQWNTEEDLRTYRSLREEADTWARRRTLLIATLAANRVLAAVTSVLAARRRNNAAPVVTLSMTPPAPREEWPRLNVVVGF